MTASYLLPQLHKKLRKQVAGGGAIKNSICDDDNSHVDSWISGATLVPAEPTKVLSCGHSVVSIQVILHSGINAPHATEH